MMIQTVLAVAQPATESTSFTPGWMIVFPLVIIAGLLIWLLFEPDEGGTDDGWDGWDAPNGHTYYFIEGDKDKREDEA